MRLYTIGHSTLPTGTFIGLLRQAGVQTVVDVRTSPYSRHAPQYCRRELADALAQAGIRYVYEGRALGGRPEQAAFYRKGAVPPDGAEYLEEVDYAAVMRAPWFLEGIERLLREAVAAPTAILCSEADPGACHRHHLIATHILRKNPSIDVIHIVEQGSFSARHLGSRADNPTVTMPSLFDDDAL